RGTKAALGGGSRPVLPRELSSRQVHLSQRRADAPAARRRGLLRAYDLAFNPGVERDGFTRVLAKRLPILAGGRERRRHTKPVEAPQQLELSQCACRRLLLEYPHEKTASVGLQGEVGVHATRPQWLDATQLEAVGASDQRRG